MAPELYDGDYSELVDIYSFGMCMLEMGIKPAALSKVKDPEVKTFIEKCLVPASQRLPARDLLKDPFLLLDVSNGNQGNHSLHLPDIGKIKTRLVASEDHCVQSKQSKSSIQQMQFHIDGDDDDNEPAFVTVIENSDGKVLHLLTLEVRKKRKDGDFRLKGERKETGSVSLNLWIANREGSAKNVGFQFYLDGDTSLSVAGEMVEQLELTQKDVKVIAGLIDSLIINLIPVWKPCVAISQMLTLDGTQTLVDEPKDLQLVECGKSSDESSQSISEVANIFVSPSFVDSSSTEGSDQPVGGAVVLQGLDHARRNGDFGDVVFVSADQDSVGNGEKSSSSCMSSAWSLVDYNWLNMEGEVKRVLSKVENGMNVDQKDMGPNDVRSPTFCLLKKCFFIGFV
ncbi:putative serine/threonine-protein kinase WNK6 [Cocos nucifera]|nr:putative serine/threonine-protein kinase WNK6 [Cocos nucifera]